jgi:hypothetical protein
VSEKLESKTNRMRRLARCIRWLGWELGWRYWRLQTACMGDPGLALRVAESAEKHAAHYRRAAAETFDLDLWESYTKAAEANELWAARVRECHAEYSVNENSPHAGNKGMNATNPESWFPRCRMAWLERYAKAAGHVGRGDLTATFGISPAQASSDLQAYLAENPDALTYSTSRKHHGRISHARS